MASPDNPLPHHSDQLDSFLTTIESKLRSPFSSLDLVKAVQTTALRRSTQSVTSTTSGGNTVTTTKVAAAKEFLSNLSQVLSRTDKVIQCRMLIGLMGLNDDATDNNHQQHDDEYSSSASSLTPEILHLLQQTQESPLYEEWVRTISGLIQGIVFRDVKGNKRGSCRSKEASEIIELQGREVSQKIKRDLRHCQQHHKPNGSGGGGGGGNAQQPDPDLNACFAPYRYALVSTSLRNTIIPEFKANLDDSKHNQNDNQNGNSVSLFQTIGTNNCHFHVNTQADILQIDWKLEEQRAKEEEQHGGTGTAGVAGILGVKNAAEASDLSSLSAKLPPGFRPAKLVNSTNGGKPKSNMFMPKKNPTSSSSMFRTSRPGGTTVGRGAVAATGKTLLRRKGGAQALVSRSTMKHIVAPATTGDAVTTAANSATATNIKGIGIGAAVAAVMAKSTSTPCGGRFAGKRRSAMAAGGSKMKMIDVQEVSDLTKQQQQQQQNLDPRASKRKRILEAAQKSITAAKKVKVESPVASPPPNPVLPPPPRDQDLNSANENQKHPEIQTTGKPAWAVQLSLPGTNKMNDQDKLRVEQFLQRHNPTPNQPTYKMKIHEERGTDGHGKEIKNTFYLELDYNTYTQKQSVKTKRY